MLMPYEHVKSVWDSFSTDFGDAPYQAAVAATRFLATAPESAHATANTSGSGTIWKFVWLSGAQLGGLTASSPHKAWRSGEPAEDQETTIKVSVRSLADCTGVDYSQKSVAEDAWGKGFVSRGVLTLHFQDTTTVLDAAEWADQSHPDRFDELLSAVWARWVELKG